MEYPRNKFQEYLIQLYSIPGVETLTLTECFLLGYSLAKHEGIRNITEIALFLVAIQRGTQQGFLDIMQKSMLEYLIFEGAYESVPALLQSFTKAKIEELKRREKEEESGLPEDKKKEDSLLSEESQHDHDRTKAKNHDQNPLSLSQESEIKGIKRMPNDLSLEYRENAKKYKEDIKYEEKQPKVLCGICHAEMFPIDTRRIKPCEHAFHPSCIKQFILDNGYKGVINCPMSICKQQVSDELIKEIVGESNVVKEIICPYSGCDSTLVQREDSTEEFACSKCIGSFCLQCRCRYHRGATCEQYRKSVPSINYWPPFKVGIILKECPQCKHWTEKALVML